MSPPAQHGLWPALCCFGRGVSVLLTVSAYTVIAPFGYLVLAVLCACWRRQPQQRARRLQRITASAYRLMFDWLALVRIARFDHRRTLPGRPQGSCVVIANHPTLMDVTAITAVLGGGCTIVKSALYRRRMLHPLLVGAGHVEGPGDDPISIGRVVDELVGRLRDGFSVIVFPEGTRSPRDRLGHFGRTAFEIACRAGVPLVSIGVRCSPRYLSKDDPLLSPARTLPELRLQVLAVDDPTDARLDSRMLREMAESRFNAWFGAALAGHPSASYVQEGKNSSCPIRSKTS